MKALKIILGILFIFSCLFNNCKNSGETKQTIWSSTITPHRPPVRCPVCDENVTWKKYGDLEIGTGPDGYLNQEWSIATKGFHIEKDCGWKIYQGNRGGRGNTYQVTSCNNSVVLIWMYGYFAAMELHKNWKGYFNDVKDSIYMGCSMDHFLKIYPGSKSVWDPTLCFIDTTEHLDWAYFDERYSVWAYFDENKKLNHLYLENSQVVLTKRP